VSFHLSGVFAGAYGFSVTVVTRVWAGRSSTL